MTRFRVIALVLRLRTSVWCVGCDAGAEQHVLRLRVHAHVLEADAMPVLLLLFELSGCPFLAKASFVPIFFLHCNERGSHKTLAFVGGTITIPPKKCDSFSFSHPTPTPQTHNHNHHAGGN